MDWQPIETCPEGVEVIGMLLQRRLGKPLKNAEGDASEDVDGGILQAIGVSIPLPESPLPVRIAGFEQLGCRCRQLLPGIYDVVVGRIVQRHLYRL